MFENAILSAVVSRTSIAVNRFGYGAREDELKRAQQNPEEWIAERLQAISFDESLPHSNDIFIEHAKYQQQKKNKQPISKAAKSYARNTLRNMSFDTLNQAIHSPNSVSWRLLDFFSNHFSVSANGRLMVGLSATLEREAIAPNLLGNFEDMLLAVEQHPAMLIYLNNEKSFGPNSRLAKKRKKGLNENLAREILELHTLGVNGGYSQNDVIELSKGITGWSVKNPIKETGAGFVFRKNAHEPGTRRFLGKNYPQKGIEQGKVMLRDLAMHSATVKYVCYKLAHHFVAENPPISLLDKMENTWIATQGNIKQVMYSLFNADEAWIESFQKFKTPREFVISSYRALAPTKVTDKALLAVLTNLGQQPFNAGSPAGYSDDISDWLGASALMIRIDWSTMISSYRKNIDIEKLMAVVFDESVSEHTYQMIMRAESRQQAFALLLLSPEFQRR